MTTQIMPHAPTMIDLRLLPVAQRRARLLTAFEALPPGAWLEVQDDQDPLEHQLGLQAQWPGLVGWEPVQVDAQSWRVRLSRRQPGMACCGCCSG